MSDFGDAFDSAHRAVRDVRFLSDLDYRWTRRFRLWERARDDPVIEDKIHAFAERCDRARRAAEDAKWACDRLWDRYSRMLAPLPGVSLARIYGLPANFEFR